MTAGEHLSPAQMEALRSVSGVLGSDRWTLIGAAAIGFHVTLPRATQDVDFVVVANAQELVPRLRAARWDRDPHRVQKWTRDTAFIDVVPLTEEDLLAGQAQLDDDFVLSAIGLDLAFEQNDPLTLDPDLSVLVPRLPVLALLKMISWLDRPERTKDLGDLRVILDSALAPDATCRWEEPLIHQEYGVHGAYFVGYEIGKISDDGHLLWARRFLDVMRDDLGAAFAQFVSDTILGDDDRAARLRDGLTALEEGLERGAWESQIAFTAATDWPLDPGRERRTPARLLHDAIARRRVVRFSYGGYDRVVEPHVLGTRERRLQVLTWQFDGHSDTGALPDWRLFFVDEITDLRVDEKTPFAGPRETRSGRHRDFDRQIAVVRQSGPSRRRFTTPGEP